MCYFLTFVHSAQSCQHTIIIDTEIETHYLNINWRDVQRKNVVINVDMPSLRASWPKTTTNRTTQKHVEHQDATNIQKKTLFVFFGVIVIIILIYNFWNKPKCKMCLLSESVRVSCNMIFYHDMYKTPPAYMIYQYYQSSVHFHKLSFAWDLKDPLTVNRLAFSFQNHLFCMLYIKYLIAFCINLLINTESYIYYLRFKFNCKPWLRLI